MPQLDFFRPPPPRRPIWLACGGGLDSFALILHELQAGRRPDGVAFCDVADGTLEREGQDPGEWPGTYRHLREVVAPLCRAEGIEFQWIDTARYPVRGERSLFAWMRRLGQIPTTGPSRLCTIVGKTERFERFLADRHPGQAVEVWVGFEAGEEPRAEKDPNAGRGRSRRSPLRVNRFPLIEAGLCRCRAEQLVRTLGFPVPRKSACTFCGYNSRGDWQTCARELPHVFSQTVQLEADKRPTRAGVKLSIAGFRTRKDAAGHILGYDAPVLPAFIAKPYRPRRIVCTVCGEIRATKATGSGWLDEAA